MYSLLWFLFLKTFRGRWVYRMYLRSATWKVRRRRIIVRDGGRCLHCNSRKPLQVHHLSYYFVGIEPARHLITLCRKCHEKAHKI